MKKKMSMEDKVITILMGAIVTCAVLTLVSYLLYVLFNIGFKDLSTIFLMSSLVVAGVFGLIRVILLATNQIYKIG